ncbi:NUDIX hydrolase [Rhizobium sp. P38BS-XIX]|uniref:NUDIX hydrolase n=1 Tax=Rhizobium sp. P38BS-XIX TaxID=2726740 RepID=UPI001980FE1A|nr:NUDIX hydrolase [Rhizobium sp. P38BS-XIX]
MEQSVSAKTNIPDEVANRQYGALCYRINRHENVVEYLLISTRETGRWAIPKGWPMDNKQAHRVAEIEALQEAGVKGKVCKRPLGEFAYTKLMADGERRPCVVQTHALKVHHLVKDFKERGQRRYAWVSCEEAAARVAEPDLKKLFFQIEEKAKSKLRRQVRQQIQLFANVVPSSRTID